MNGIVKNFAVQGIKETCSVQVFEQLFKDLSKALIDIAYALNHSKDMKDIFVDLFEGV
jgi:hypothetical protein